MPITEKENNKNVAQPYLADSQFMIWPEAIYNYMILIEVSSTSHAFHTHLNYPIISNLYNFDIFCITTSKRLKRFQTTQKQLQFSWN